jgi:hypothetical protein
MEFCQVSVPDGTRMSEGTQKLFTDVQAVGVDLSAAGVYAGTSEHGLRKFPG